MNGEPTETIKDKEQFHRLDGLRYVVGDLFKPQTRSVPGSLISGGGVNIPDLGGYDGDEIPDLGGPGVEVFW